MLSIGPRLYEARSTVDLLTALFAQCQKVVPARLKPRLQLPAPDNRRVPQRPAQGYMGQLRKGIHPVPLSVVPAQGLGRTSLDLTEPPSSTLLRVDWSALAPDLPNVDYSSLNYARDVLLHGSEVAYEVNSRWPRLLLHMQYELNGSPPAVRLGVPRRAGRPAHCTAARSRGADDMTWLQATGVVIRDEHTTDTDTVLGALLALYAHSKYFHVEWLKQALDEGYLTPNSALSTSC